MRTGVCGLITDQGVGRGGALMAGVGVKVCLTMEVLTLLMWKTSTCLTLPSIVKQV